MKKIFDIFHSANKEIFLVGGYIRDKLLGKKSNDFDFATNALPKETIDILSKNGLKAIETGVEFGTIQTILDGEKVEITTFRCSESYTKGSRKPKVVFGKTIEEDLARRDFRFNSIAMKEDGSIVDPFNGQEDLENGIIRTPGDPIQAFTDDPLRILRTARFVARGLGEIEYKTWNAMANLKYLVHELSAERVFEEMTKLLMAEDPVAGLRILDKTEILGELFLELMPVVLFTKDTGKWHHLSIWEHTLVVVENTPAIPEVRWAALFHDVAKPICWSNTSTGIHFLRHDKIGSEIWESIATRLKISNEFKTHVSTLIFEHQCLRNEMGDKGVRRLIHRLGDRLDNLFAHTHADIIGHTPHIVKPKLKELDALRARVDKILAGPESVTNKMPRGTGDVVCEALNIKPGPELGSVMRRLQQMMVDGEISSASDFAMVARKLR